MTLDIKITRALLVMMLIFVSIITASAQQTGPGVPVIPEDTEEEYGPGTPGTPKDTTTSYGPGSPETPKDTTASYGPGSPQTPSDTTVDYGPGTPQNPDQTDQPYGPGTPNDPAETDHAYGPGTPNDPQDVGYEFGPGGPPRPVITGLKEETATSIQIVPNPVGEIAIIKVTMPRSENASISLLDIRGKQRFLKEQLLHKGENEIRLNIKELGLVKGEYILKISSESISKVRRLMVR